MHGPRPHMNAHRDRSRRSQVRDECCSGTHRTYEQNTYMHACMLHACMHAACMHTGARGVLQRPCAACRKSRVKCDYLQPCSRCVRLHTCMCMCMCMRVHACTHHACPPLHGPRHVHGMCMRVHACTHAPPPWPPVCRSKHSHTHACPGTCTRPCTRARLHTWMHGRMHAFIYACMPTSTHASLPACMPSCLHAYLHTAYATSIHAGAPPHGR